MTHRELIESYVDAWRERDPEKIASHFAADGERRWEVVVPPVLGGPNRYRGRAAIAAPVRCLIEAIPDLGLEPRTLAETDEGAMLEWRHFGVHTGSWSRWTGQGEPVEFSGVSVYTIAGDEIAEERIYFDPDLLARQWVPPLGTLMGVGMQMWKQGRATKRARAAA